MSYHDPSVGPFVCDICHFRFRTNRKRLKHVDLHRLKFACSTCGLETRDRSSARRHYAQHGGARYPCQHCQAVFQRPTSLFNHVRAQHPAQNVSCQSCGETFLSPRGVLLHQARTHRPNVKPEEFECPTCNIPFSSSEALDRHTGSDEHSSWPCAECGEGCSSEEMLKAHVDSHIHNHPCEECNMSFNSSAALTTHHARKHLNVRRSSGKNPRVRGHTAAARVVCETCGRMLQNETALKYHQRTHQAVKPFACEHCPKTFAAKHARDWHTRTHTGERPFQCEQCAQTFSLRGNLQRHRRVVHQGVRGRTPCPLCGAVFTTRAGVRLHLDTVHRRLHPPKRGGRREKHS